MMSDHDHSRTAGDYRLLEVLSEKGSSRVWLAEQSSIGRKVLVEELRAENADRRDDFLADARAKASVDHPLVASVYEAVADDERCFFARELLSAHTLAELANAGGTLSPPRLTQILRRVAEAQLHLESAGKASAPLDLEHIHVDDHEMVRLDNLATAGERDSARSAADIARLGTALRPLVAEARPGTTRVLTLLSWMRGEDIVSPLDWRQVVEVCRQIEQQLGQPGHTVTPTLPMKRRSHWFGIKLATAVTLCALAVVFALVWQLRPDDGAPDSPAESVRMIDIPAGRYPMPDGGDRMMPAFRIANREVSVGEYAAFLDTLETLAKSDLERSFDHREQPAGKTTHLPDDWPQQLKTPPHLPVTGVDWWDAAAFASWKKSRLPTQEQWFAAMHGAADPSAIHHSVHEWTRLAAVDPANPLGGAKWVIVRRSPAEAGQVRREWLTDRSLRRPDLGFRICLDDE
ncbi:MAG TPA: SUMF1/EgtB/PvdO family nonheme iron enzyme [Luteolibacter sp.]|nr:SUMF1/EgtB/PvdO family nonheme iron enzyme [Luteolibacter sp.]